MLNSENNNERAYRSMHFVGVVNVVLGILVVAVSAICGGFIIANGAKLIKDKSGITF